MSPLQAPTAPATSRPPRRLVDRIRCLAGRVGRVVRAAHSARVPF